MSSVFSDVSQYHIASFVGDDTCYQRLTDQITLLLNNKEVNYYVVATYLNMCMYTDISKTYSIIVDCSKRRTDEIFACLAKVFTDIGMTNITFVTIHYMLQNYCMCFNNLQKLIDCHDMRIKMKTGESHDVLFSKKILSECTTKLLINEMYEGKTLLHYLDLHCEENYVNIEIVGKLIDMLYLPQMCDDPHVHKLYNNVINNMKTIYMYVITKSNKIQFELCKLYVCLFMNYNKYDFLMKYEKALLKRLNWKYNKNSIDFEKQIVKLFETLTQTSTPNIENIKSIICRMNKQINDCSDSSNFSHTFTTKLNIKNVSYPKLDIDPKKCSFEIIHAPVWDIEPSNNECSNKEHLVDDIKAYLDIFEKIYDCTSDNVVIDMKNSTSVLNIDISGKTYNFKVSFQQLTIITLIIDSNGLTSDELYQKTHFNKICVDTILSCLCDYDILLFENDKFMFNSKMQFNDDNLSLLHICDANDKYDENIVLCISDIIIKNKLKSVDEIVDKYVHDIGMMNYTIIENVVNYMIQNDIICLNNDVYCINEKTLDEIKSIISN